MEENKTCKTCKERVRANDFCNLTGRSVYRDKEAMGLARWKKACEDYKEEDEGHHR